VHDPKIAGKSEVKAQIKLKFKNRIPQVRERHRERQSTASAEPLTAVGARGSVGDHACVVIAIRVWRDGRC